MKRTSVAVAAVLGALLIVSGTTAQMPAPMPAPYDPASVSTGHAWHDFWAKVDLHRRRVNAWPDPFVAQDRELVRSPFRTMADNGWKLQHTLSEHLFDPNTQELTYAGQRKLRWILTQVPPHRRQVYVLEATTAAGTAARVESVCKHMAEIAPGTNPGTVFTTRIIPPAGDGSYLDDVDQTYRGTIPVPHLSTTAVGGGAAVNGTAPSGQGGPSTGR